MKTKFILLSICLNQFFLHAQEFSTKFYLTSKSGMKDSIVLGYDKSASFGIDSQFGEVGYSSPVNSDKFGASIIINESTKILSQLINANEIAIFSKKQIVPLRESVFIEQNAIGIMIPVDSLPITVSWNDLDFTNIQRDFSLITDWSVGLWFDASDGKTSFLKNLNETNFIQVKDRVANYFHTDLANKYPMYIFYIAFGNNSNLKADLKNTNETHNSDLAFVKNGFIEFKENLINNINHVSIYNCLGKLVFNNSSNQITNIDINYYNNGVYILYIVTDNAKYSYKIIKN
jgi:hypothetical protein